MTGKLQVQNDKLTVRKEIPLFSLRLTDEEISRVVEVLQSGKLREGPVCRAFEEKFASLVGANFAISVSSGTAALHVAYAAALSPGDEVLVPSFTFIATASMVSMVGAKPVFCDVDPNTFTLDPDDAAKRITPRTKAIAPVHLFGNPCNIEKIINLAQKYNLKIIWDAAQAHGAKYQKQDIGSFDDLVCYSFYPSKNMTTGEGGMITTNDQSLYQKCKLLRSHGQSGKYYHTLLGFNYRLTDFMAALGIEQLKNLLENVRRRRENARYLSEQCSDISIFQLPKEQPEGESSYNLYSILLNLNKMNVSRDKFLELLKEERITAQVHYPRPLHKQPVFEKDAADISLPISEDLSQRIFSLPVHPLLTQEDLEFIVKGMKKVVKQALN